VSSAFGAVRTPSWTRVLEYHLLIAKRVDQAIPNDVDTGVSCGKAGEGVNRLYHGCMINTVTIALWRPCPKCSCCWSDATAAATACQQWGAYCVEKATGTETDVRRRRDEALKVIPPGGKGGSFIVVKIGYPQVSSGRLFGLWERRCRRAFRYVERSLVVASAKQSAWLL
jgi:hypothetical protein